MHKFMDSQGAWGVFSSPCPSLKQAMLIIVVGRVGVVEWFSILTCIWICFISCPYNTPVMIFHRQAMRAITHELSSLYLEIADIHVHVMCFLYCWCVVICFWSTRHISLPTSRCLHHPLPGHVVSTGYTSLLPGATPGTGHQEGTCASVAEVPPQLHWCRDCLCLCHRVR